MNKRIMVVGLILSICMSVILSGCGVITDVTDDFAKALVEAYMGEGSSAAVQEVERTVSADQEAGRPQPVKLGSSARSGKELRRIFFLKKIF